jgi:hypothetical protein
MFSHLCSFCLCGTHVGFRMGGVGCRVSFRMYVTQTCSLRDVIRLFLF